MSRSVFVAAALILALAPAVGAEGEAFKIGIFDPDVVWKQTEIGKKYNQDLTAARDRLQTEIDKKQGELEALKEKMRQQSATLSEERLAQMQKEAQNKVIEVNRMTDDATREMKQQLAEAQGRFQQMLLDTLEAYGREKGYSLILDKTVVAFNAPQAEVTLDLISKFNEMHKAGAAPAKTPARKAPEKPKEPPR